MVRCKVINKTDHQIFIDKAGLGNKEDIITVPPRGAMVLNIATDKQFINLVKKYRNQLIFIKQ